MGILDKTIAASLQFIPKPMVRQVARRYVAGETLSDAVAETRRQNQAGAHVTIDLLGEDIRQLSEARKALETYLEVLDTIRREELDATISIKPTQFGMLLDWDRFMDNVRTLLRKASELDIFVRIDMEDSSTTDRTLDAWRTFRQEGFENVGFVLQAMLRRTPEDARKVADLRPNIRICKGIYQEPESVAWQSYEEINRAYLAFLDEFLPDERYTLAIATHDDPLIDGAEERIRRLGVSRERYEFQMLLGVRPEIRERLLSAGHQVRVYVPFGKDWYAYCVRRLKENPKFAGYVTKDVLKDPSMLFGKGQR